MGKISYVFSNGIVLDDKRIYNQKLQGTATNNNLCFGTIASNYLELVIDNTDLFFDDYSFKNVYINIYDDDKKKMKVYIDSVKEKNKLITIKAYDKLINLDKTWIPCKTPITLYAFIDDICKQASINMFAFNLINGGFKIQNIDELKGKTCRECLSYALEICGTYAFLDSNEQLTFKWFNFNNVNDIDISKLIDYNTDYEDSTVDNIYFIRGSKVYYLNENPNGSIFLTNDNPLLKEASSGKIQSIINNLSSKINFSYLPCTIKAADFFTYNIGDVVKFIDDRGEEKFAIIGTISYSGYNSCSITSVNVDEQDIVTSETESSIANNSSISGDITFYKKINNPDMEYTECSDITEIQYFLNANCTTDDSIQVVVNNIPYKTFNVRQGNFTIALMLKGDIIDDSTTTIDIVTNNVLEDIEVNTLFRNCMVIDYNEEDEEIEIGEIEMELPSGYFFRNLSTLYINTCIMGWKYKNYDFTLNNGQYNSETLYYDNGSTFTNTDDEYFPEIYTTKMKDLYLDLRDSKMYIKIGMNGTFTDYYNNIFEFNNDGFDGESGIIYKKKHKDETDYKYYKTSNGIVEIQDGDTIQFGYLCQTYKEPDFSQFDNIDLQIYNLNEVLTFAKCDYQYYKNTLDWEDGTLNIMKPNFNHTVNDSDGSYNRLEKYIGNYYDNSNFTKFEDNNISFPMEQSGNRSLFAYREYTTNGYEKITEIQE